MPRLTYNTSGRVAIHSTETSRHRRCWSTPNSSNVFQGRDRFFSPMSSSIYFPLFFLLLVISFSLPFFLSLSAAASFRLPGFYFEFFRYMLHKHSASFPRERVGYSINYQHCWGAIGRFSSCLCKHAVGWGRHGCMWILGGCWVLDFIKINDGDRRVFGIVFCQLILFLPISERTFTKTMNLHSTIVGRGKCDLVTGTWYFTDRQ